MSRVWRHVGLDVMPPRGSTPPAEPDPSIPRKLSGLSNIERRFIELLRAGRNFQEIAEELGIGPEEVPRIIARLEGML
jgi:DNA-binding NarL/FixJ family response regulator